MTDPVERPEAETTAEERAKLRALAEKDLRTPMPEPADALAEALEPRWFCLLLDDLARAEASAKEATARAERLAGALPDLDPVITWLADGCHVPSAVASLRLLKGRIDAALLTEPEAKGGDPDTHVDDDGRTADRTDPNGAEPTNIAQPARDPDPVPATREKTDD